MALTSQSRSIDRLLRGYGDSAAYTVGRQDGRERGTVRNLLELWKREREGRRGNQSQTLSTLAGRDRE
jgi:hypothetical protein